MNENQSFGKRWLIRPRKRLSSESITKSAAHSVIWRK